MLGALFNYGLLNAARLYKLLPNSSCLQNFLLLAVTAITGLYLPEALGGGDDLLTNTAFNSYPVTVLLMFLAAKITAYAARLRARAAGRRIYTDACCRRGCRCSYGRAVFSGGPFKQRL